MKCHRYGKEDKQQNKEEEAKPKLDGMIDERGPKRKKNPGQNKLPSCYGG
jgi:hypothetical protein